MNEREVIRRLQAYHKGRPVPRGETRRVHVALPAECLMLSFVRMGGESRPWGIAFGPPDSPPRILTVPEARNRDLVAGMVQEFAPVLLAHLRSPEHCDSKPESPDDLAPLRQVWVPNPTHLEMLHHLAFAYTFPSFESANQSILNAFGRACGWLFREAHRPGQQAVVVATAALRDAFSFPSEQARQGHLGFLLAWLDAEGDRADRA